MGPSSEDLNMGQVSTFCKLQPETIAMMELCNSERNNGRIQQDRKGDNVEYMEQLEYCLSHRYRSEVLL